MIKAINSQRFKILAGAVSAQVLTMILMQSALAEPYYGRVNAYDRAVDHQRAAAFDRTMNYDRSMAFAANRAAAFNQAAAINSYNRAAAYNQAATAAAYNRALAYNQAAAMNQAAAYNRAAMFSRPVVAYNPYGYNPYYRPSVFTTHPILSGTLVGGGVGALGGAAIAAVETSGDRTDKGKNIAIGTAVGAGSGAAVGMGIGLIRNKMLYGYY